MYFISLLLISEFGAYGTMHRNVSAVLGQSSSESDRGMASAEWQERHVLQPL